MKTAVLLDNNNGLLITGGLMQIGEVTQQNQKMLVSINKGELKLKPLVGVGTAAYLESSDTSGLAGEIRRQLQADGMRVRSISVRLPEIIIDAYYA
jgi:hypothetical protein